MLHQHTRFRRRSHHIGGMPPGRPGAIIRQRVDYGRSVARLESPRQTTTQGLCACLRETNLGRSHRDRRSVGHSVHGRSELMMRVIPTLLVVVASLIPVRAATAQSAIAGVVRDTTGAVLPGVDRRSQQPGADRKGQDGDHQRGRSVPHRRPAARHLHGDVHACRGSRPWCARASCSRPTSRRRSTWRCALGAARRASPSPARARWSTCRPASRQQVVSQELLEALPTGRNFELMAGHHARGHDRASSTSAARARCGPAAACWCTARSPGDSRTLIDGMVVDAMFGSGQCSCVYDNEAQTQEIAVQVSGGAAENQLSGVLVNRIPKTGGNKFSGRRPRCCSPTADCRATTSTTRCGRAA